MSRFHLIFTLLFSIVVLSTSCDKEEPMIPNEEELITNVTYTLTPDNGGDTVTMTFEDLDGDGGNDPVITGGTLDANQNYSGVLRLTNETETPAENITDEIAEEDEEHQFFFSSSVAGLTIAYDDQDGDGNPLGLRSTVTVGDAGSGNITVILRHEPNKSADGVAGGDITNAGGETDIQVTFPVDVQ